MGPLLGFMTLVQELAREKENRLRQGLNVVGVSHGAYWLSWFIISTLINILQTCVFVLSGYITNFTMWQHTAASLLFYIHFVYCMTMTIVAFMVSTVVTKQDTANTVSYTLILGFIMIGLCFAQAFFSLRIFYETKNTWAIPAAAEVGAFFELLPPYNFCMSFGIIAGLASPFMDVDHLEWTKAVDFTWPMFY